MKVEEDAPKAQPQQLVRESDKAACLFKFEFVAGLRQFYLFCRQWVAAQ
jgi:hypothetical protein